MEARIAFGRVMHRRLRPLVRAFSYRVFFLQVPLAKWDALGLRWLSVDRWNVFSLMRRDFGPRDGSDLGCWIRGQLARHGVLQHCDGEVVLQAFPRILGYAFNPIALWLCHDRDGALRAVLCEVSNTFGERHNYLVRHRDGRAIAPGEELTAPKRFHVSPFCAVEGHYRFGFSGGARHPHARIDYHDGGGLLLATALHGEARPLRDRALAFAFLAYPAMTLAVIARIHWQALQLWIQRVPWFPKPAPRCRRRPLNATEYMDAPDSLPPAARGLFRALAGLACGRLTLTTPDGVRRRYEGPRPGPVAEIAIRDWRAVGAMVRRAEIGIFTCWRDGWIATPDMTALLELCARNEAALREVFYGGPLAALLLRLAHALRPNTRAGSRRNIHAHYDLGNAFYGLWLDRGMSYSSGLFGDAPEIDLETAQEAKYERLLELLEVQASHEVLEIGCGWGAFAERAARTRGCRVTGVTVSPAQLEYAQARMRSVGLAHRVDLQLRDYRDLGGQYDRIVSVEMVEAVGERYWPTYFRTLRERLKPGGRAALQSIVVAEEAFEKYRRSSDFIREYVFPGGMLPSVSRIAAAARDAGLEARTPFLFGQDYARTLRLWRAAFDARETAVRALGFDDDFLATWRFYLDYCEAGFNAGRVDVMQIELARPR